MTELFAHNSSLAIPGLCAGASLCSSGVSTSLILSSGAHCQGLLLLASAPQPLKAPVPSFQGGRIWISVSFGLTAIIYGCQSDNRNWNQNNKRSLLLQTCYCPFSLTSIQHHQNLFGFPCSCVLHKHPAQPWQSCITNSPSQPQQVRAC